MKIKRWLEIALIVLVIILSIKMFMVDEMIGLLIFIVNAILITIIDWYGTLIKELNAKLSYFMNEE